MKKEFDPGCITFSQMNMIFNARLFQRMLTVWTRIYLISRYEGIGTAEEAFGRLYLENMDFGDQLQILFGRINADRYSRLLNEFSVGIREMITAQLRGDTEAMQRAVDRLYRNKEERAAFLISINPYLDESQWQEMLTEYLRLTIEEANAFASHNYERDIALYDRLIALSDSMGYVFSEALYDYITSGGRCTNDLLPEQCLTYDQMNAIFGIRMLWFEIATWSRAYMLSKIKNIGNVEEVYARFRQVSDEFSNVMRAIFGEEAAVTVEQHVDLFIELLDALITAQMEEDTETADRSVKLLYQDARAHADFLGSLNPVWQGSEWETILYDIVRNLIDESIMLLSGNYAENQEIFATLLDKAEAASEYFARGIYQYAAETGLSGSR